MSEVSGAQFSAEDFLISRTDKRGVITGANRAFQRISGYSREELLDAPHKILRHPDMPKGVFWLMWDGLKRGEPQAAVVKNKTKDGNHYWVIAAIAPTKDGYISIRFKPAIGTIERIEKIYKTMKDWEVKENLSAEESAKRFIDGLGDHGFSSYLSFMARSLTRGWLAREKMRGLPHSPDLLTQTTALDEWREVRDECDKIFGAYTHFGHAALNMRLQSAQLGEVGQPLSVIATNFSKLAQSINTELTDFTRDARGVTSAVHQTLLMTCLRKIYEEAIVKAREEMVADDGATFQQDVDIIQTQSEDYRTRARKTFGVVGSKLGTFIDLSDRLKRSLFGLSVTRVMCAIESSKITQTDSMHIQAIIEQLSNFQEITDTGLRQIRGGLITFRQTVKGFQ